MSSNSISLDTYVRMLETMVTDNASSTLYVQDLRNNIELCYTNDLCQLTFCNISDTIVRFIYA